MTYDQYADRWEEIASVFSHDAVLRGAFDAHAENGKTKRGTTEVDEAFLAEIERWRELLANNIALRNQRLTAVDLNFAVQRTIDRIIFLRICEDRGAETYGRLRKLTEGSDVYKRLVERFHRADERYNSGLFHFRTERDRAEAHDELTPGLSIDDKVLREILQSLYYPASPYEFSVLPADILGHVYEQFLGKVIRLTPGRRAKVEEKPEVRKAGGVYYTPSYIVDYLVGATLGKLLEHSTPAAAARIRVVDPACGSGSFLLGAYQHLLDWHLAFYLQHDPEKYARQRDAPIFRGPSGAWRLSIQKRKEILVNSIFGVDVDAQAIEVSKLSLLLKVLEGETEETLNHTLKLFDSRALPDLGKNLRHGNSLIGTEFATSGQLRLPTLEDDRVNPFDWSREFPAIFQDGGFDVVIGNPPYLSYAGRQAIDIPKDVREFFGRTYETAGWPAAHAFFLERSIKLLARRFVAFIVPDQVGHLAGYESVRIIASREAGVAEVRYWGERVFKGVTTPALTVVVDKAARGCKTTVFNKDGTEGQGDLVDGEPWTFSESLSLVRRLHVRSGSLGTLVADCGIRTTDAKAQVVELSAAKGKFVPVLEGKRVQRYRCEEPDTAVRLDSKAQLFVTDRSRFEAVQFVIRQTAAYPIVGPREHAIYFRNSLLALFAPSDGVDVRYLVALLNSRLLRFAYVTTVRESQQRTFPQVKIAALRNLPIRRLDLTHASDRQKHDELVAHAADALAIQSQLRNEKNPIRRESLQRRFEAVDSRIDQCVYSLYELSSEDVAVVERVVNSLLTTADKPSSWRPPTSGPIGSPRRTSPTRPAAVSRKRAGGRKS